jgi:hypothetical protein
MRRRSRNGADLEAQTPHTERDDVVELPHSTSQGMASPQGEQRSSWNSLPLYCNTWATNRCSVHNRSISTRNVLTWCSGLFGSALFLWAARSAQNVPSTIPMYESSVSEEDKSPCFHDTSNGLTGTNEYRTNCVKLQPEHFGAFQVSAEATALTTPLRYQWTCDSALHIAASAVYVSIFLYTAKYYHAACGRLRQVLCAATISGKSQENRVAKYGSFFPSNSTEPHMLCTLNHQWLICHRQ